MSDMPRTKREWDAHQAFYRLAIAQRDAAWRELETKDRRIDELIAKHDKVVGDAHAVNYKVRALEAEKQALTNDEDQMIQLVLNILFDRDCVDGRPTYHAAQNLLVGEDGR